MLAQDIKPNRLELAKDKIRSVIQALSTDRIGLILFSGSSFIQCPLTHDKNAFAMFLNQVDSDTISGGSTAIAKAIGQAIQAFAQSGTKKNKLLIIFTDGEDFSSDLSTLKKQAHEQGLTIFTIGIGTTQGAPIPLFDAAGKQSGHIKDKKGSVVISRLNESMLQELAHEVGGIYLHASTSNNDLQQLIDLIKQKEKEKNEEKQVAQLQEQYPFFILVSFICLALAGCYENK